jgi:hypothetical protein
MPLTYTIHTNWPQDYELQIQSSPPPSRQDNRSTLRHLLASIARPNHNLFLIVVTRVVGL